MLSVVKKFVENSLSKPNLVLAGILLVLPFALLFIFGLFLGLPINFGGLFFQLIREAALFIIAAGLLYLLIYYLKGNDVKGKFTGILTALSIRYAFNIALLLVSIIIIFAVVPEFFTAIREIDPYSLSNEEAVNELGLKIEQITVQNEGALAIGFGLILLFVLAFIAMNLYLVYSIIKHSSKENPSRAFFVFILFFVLQLLLLAFF